MGASGQRRDNLPVDVTSFVGRRGLIDEARQVMTTSRLLSFVGPGGIGKTRLGLRVAAQVKRTFSDGVWFVELADLTDDKLVGRAVATTLGLRDQSGEPSIDVVSEYLEDKHLLLVLDNCEQLLDSVAVLTRKLLGRAPRLWIMATSRQPLCVEGEHVLHVPPLTIPDADHSEAVALFTDRAEAASSTFKVTAENRDQVTSLCERLAGLPLAIELAAVRVRTLTVAQIAGRLTDLSALTGNRAAPARQQTLRGAIDWSFELCSPAEQTMWGRVSVFAGGFRLEDAEKVCGGDGIDEADVFDLVAGLTEKSILFREGDRYFQLEPLREYGAGLPARSGDLARLRVRHRDRYLRMAAQAEAEWLGPNQTRWLGRLREETANLRAALAFCLTEPGEAAKALELASSLWNYWIHAFGSYADGRTVLDRALALDTAPSRRRAKALWVNGWFALRQGDIAGAAELIDECHALARSLGDTSALACATHFRALIAFFSGRVDDAVALLEEADRRYRAENDPAGRWMALFHQVMAASTAGDNERADACGAQCLALCEEQSAYLSRSNALWAVGYGRWLQGDQRRATTLIVEGLRVMRETGDIWGAAECLEVLAWIAAADGEYEHSTRLLGAAQATWRSVGAAASGPGPLAASHDQCETLLRDRLGEEAFVRALRAGGEAGLDRAVASALDEPGKPRARAKPDAKDLLTRRERQVVGLIAQGMSNKEIAATLVIAKRTAECHVENILTKLGFRSRTQVATWAAEQKAG
jgi:predicted ATPase/DNA-binding CsgD family transcriptional regulator